MEQVYFTPHEVDTAVFNASRGKPYNPPALVFATENGLLEAQEEIEFLETEINDLETQREEMQRKISDQEDKVQNLQKKNNLLNRGFALFEGILALAKQMEQVKEESKT